MTGAVTVLCGRVCPAYSGREGVVTKKGPFDMGGVGGLAALTRDKWMVLGPLANGKKQAVRCHSMT